MRTVTVQFGVAFTNRNRAMNLRAHGHHADVRVTFAHRAGCPGWPSFEATNRALADHVRHALASPVVGTNEDVVQVVYDTVVGFDHETILRDWPGCWWFLQGVTLDVLAEHDAIGHDAGVTRYTIDEAVMLLPGHGP